MVLTVCSCLGYEKETIVIEEPSTGIPDDALATPNPSVTDITAYIPNFNATVDYIGSLIDEICRLTEEIDGCSVS